MKKVAIITFHASDNCGSMLQAYALQQTLNVLNIENVIIDFSNEKQVCMYSIFVDVKRSRDFLRNILRLILYPILKKEQIGFRKFRNFYQITSKVYHKNEELKELDGKYDCFITGSDQVWNFKAGDYDDAYFLNFVKYSKKITYATSLGQANLIDTMPHSEKYKALLNDFSNISVREEKSKGIVESIWHDKVEICLDPTFLLESASYDKFIGTPLIAGKYIFCYAFDYHKQFCEEVLKLAQRLNMPVYMMDRKQYYIKRTFIKGIKLTPKAGPEAFLNIFKYASMIFTTSFHGTAFSVILKKKFWYLNETAGEGDGRATSLLRQMGLMERYVTRDEIEKADIIKEIDFDLVSDKLKTLRMNSINYLKNSIL